MRYLLLLILSTSSLYASSISLKLFTHTPPHHPSLSYTFELRAPSIRSLTKISSPSILNSSLNHLMHELPLATVPCNKTILWIPEGMRSFHLMDELTLHGNRITTLRSKTALALSSAYLKIEPDILFLPVSMTNKVNSLIEHTHIKKDLSVIFYPLKTPTPNLIISLPNALLDTKLSKHPSSAPWVHVLAYTHSISTPTEAFVLKKLTKNKQGDLILKNTKQHLYTSPSSLNLSSKDHIIIISSSLEDKHLAMGGCLDAWKHKQLTVTELNSLTSSYKKDLKKALSIECKTLYIFLPHHEHRLLLKYLKDLKTLPTAVFAAYYTSPWKDKWNLYHYHKGHGTHLNAWRGLLEFGKELKISSLEKLGSTTAECYLVKHFPLGN